MTPSRKYSHRWKNKGEWCFPVKRYSWITKPLWYSSNVQVSNIQKETLFLYLKDHFLEKMTDKVHFDLTKIENYVRNKTYPKEILSDNGKKSNFWKAC